MSITKRDERVAIIKMKMKKICLENDLIMIEFLKTCRIYPNTWRQILNGQSTSFKNIYNLVKKNKYFTYQDFEQILNTKEHHDISKTED